MRLVKYRGRWCVAVAGDAGSERRSLRLPPSASRQDAERAFLDYQRNARTPADTVGAIMAAYLADKRTTATAYQRMEDAWKALRPHAAHFRPDQIDRAWSRAYVAARREAGRQDGTIRRELTTLRAALRWHNKATPAVLELPSPPPPADRWITKADVERLIAAADRPHIALAIRLLYATAGRKEAVLELTWDRVNLDRGIVDLALFTGKRRKGRATVAIGPRTVEALRTAKEGALTDHVIEWAGRPVRSIRTGFDAACRRAGLADVSPHVIRHSAAIHMASNGIGMAKIAQFLGHQDSRITERVYARFAPDHMRDMAALLD
jgi:integrase